jgi:hypothetical protein
VPAKPAPQSPLWWLARLHARIEKQAAQAARLEAYYTGDHPLPDLPEKAKDAFRRLLKQSRANFTGLVVDATAERLQVDGFRFGGDRQGDTAASAIWQANGLDAESELAFTDATSLSRSFMFVWPNDERPEYPLVTVEHMSQVAVECAPGNRRRRIAAAKVWLDDWTGKMLATVYLPASPLEPDGAVYKYVSAKPRDYGQDCVDIVWKPRLVEGEDWPLRNPFGDRLSIVELPNRPNTLKGPRSEIEDVLDIQDRIDKTIADRLIAQEYGAFAQKWVTGMEIPEDDDGNPVAPFNVAIDRLLMAEESEAKFGNFSATDLGPYITAAESDIMSLSSITKTPPHYLLNRSGQPVSGDALKAAEAGLIAKVRKRQRHYGEALEEVMRLAFAAAGDDRADDFGAETIWRNPEFRTEGETVDALVKMRTLGVPLEALWERWGATQEEITRWRGMLEQEAARQATSLGVSDLLANPDPAATEGEPTPPIGE